jgi:hypothetical protein
MVVRPNSNEVPILQTAAELSAGVFACDAHAVYSNVSSIEGIPTIAAIRGSMDVEMGGLWKSAMNTPLFQMVYRKMFYDGTYRKHDWVVKVDADTVLNVAALRRTLAPRAQAAASPGLYGAYNNPGGVIHGAIMVMTVPALEHYAQNKLVCENNVDASALSEDWYLGYCFQYLGVHKQQLPHLLKEVVQHYGDGRRRRASVTGGGALCNQQFVAFHPLKNPTDYRSCVQSMHP